ncbi:MAG: hypothetical protein Q7S33_05645 [Nanoarchaeota archaeon]|nr:hypothetical protein [Nanoarchaeota archaeon]
MENSEEEISFFMPERDEDIFEDGSIHIELHDVKISGARWRFHKNDKDPFPSKPHGHNIETGDKVNIWTGEVYDKNKTLTYKLSEKHILFIQSKLMTANFI